MDPDESDYRPTNRDKVRAPKGTGSAYCRGCDCDTVWDGQKCNTCGRRDGPHREKPKAG